METSITVRVIFWGLMAFVPNDQSERGLTALLVDPRPPITRPGPIPEHIPVVYLLEGNCTPQDQCFRGGGVATELGPIKPQLVWRIAGEDLEIFGEEHRVKFHKDKRQRNNGSLLQAPRWRWQINDFSWVSSMETLTWGHGIAREDCLNLRETCPVHSRFRVRGGTAESCHLYHRPDDHPKNSKRDVPIFNYLPATNPPLRQAVADAFKVEFDVEGDHVELRAWALPHGTRQQLFKAAAQLRPSRNSRTITLIVVNAARQQEDDSHHNMALAPRPHSDFLYDLLARQPVPRLLRDEKYYTITRIRPGSCEAEVSALAQPKYDDSPGIALDRFDARSLPHSPTLCDGAVYK
jgi:hypothetical protein